MGTLLLIALPIYFIPAFVAGGRHHKNGLAIMMLNLFLGWTFIGWVIALVWACTENVAAKPEPEPAGASAAAPPRQPLTPQELDALARSLGRPW
jgi:hypothetical protein